MQFSKTSTQILDANPERIALKPTLGTLEAEEFVGASVGPFFSKRSHREPVLAKQQRQPALLQPLLLLRLLLLLL